MKSEHEIVEEMTQVVEQMRLDDLEDNPEMAEEYFDCDCCGENKCLAGSIEYEGVGRVKKQFPAPNATLKRGEKFKLVLSEKG